MATRRNGTGAIAPLGIALLGVMALDLPANSQTLQEADTASALPSAGMLAQATGACQAVAPEGGLYVREAPSPYSEAIAALSRGSQVTVRGAATESWVAVSAPLAGFMFGPYLVPCGTLEAAIAPSGTGLCRQVISEGGLYIREAPSAYSEAIAAVPLGAQVTVQGQSVDEWVPVSAPQPGFMFSTYLGACG